MLFVLKGINHYNKYAFKRNDCSLFFQTCSEDDFISGKHCYSSSQAAKNAVSKCIINCQTHLHVLHMKTRFTSTSFTKWLWEVVKAQLLISSCLLQYLFAGEHLDLTAMMNTWTLQKGIPMVTVTRKGSRLLLRQDRFLRTVLPSDSIWPTLQKGWVCTCTRNSNSHNTQIWLVGCYFNSFFLYSFLWHIPLTYKTDASSSIHRHLMTTHTGRKVAYDRIRSSNIFKLFLVMTFSSLNLLILRQRGHRRGCPLGEGQHWHDRVLCGPLRGWWLGCDD